MAVEYSDLNWLAFALSALANIVIGFLWYSPTLPIGKAWMRYSGHTVESRPPPGAMAKSMLLMLVGVALLYFVFAHTFAAYGAAGTPIDLANGLMGGFFVWLGFFLPVQLNMVAFTKKPWGYFAIDAGYYLVVMLVAGALFGTVG